LQLLGVVMRGVSSIIRTKLLLASVALTAFSWIVPSAADTIPDKSAMTQSILSGDFKSAFQIAEKSAESGDKEAQFNLAIFYYHGIGVPQNFEYALRWANMSGLQGFKKALAARPPIIEKVQPDTVQAVMAWVRQRLIKAAEEGDNVSLVMLSNSFAPEFGFADSKEAYYWASLAVAAGRTEAKRRRDALVKELKAPDFKEVQDRSAEWFAKFRKSST
jgi:TPR repeat protein